VPTEKLLIFDEAGNAKRVKARLTRFLENEPVTSTEKAAIRSTLSVPASAEGLTPANNLSDVSNAATSRANLDVNSTAQDAEATGTKLVSPSLYFDGTNDYIEIADSSKLSFTDGTDDLPFSISAWVNLDGTSLFCPIGKWASAREWLFYITTGNILTLNLRDASARDVILTTDSAFNGFQSSWNHIAVTYGGSGPNSSTAFASSMDAATVYINGQAVASTANNNASYTGMANNTDVVQIGKFVSNYSKGHIKEVKIFNRELSASEVVDSMNGDLGFADEWGGALGGVYTQDATPSGEWFSNRGTDADEAGPVGGKSNILKFTVDTNLNQHFVFHTTSGTIKGKRYRAEANVYIPSGQSNVDGLRMSDGSTSSSYNLTSPTLDAWNKISLEFVASVSSFQLRFYALDGGSVSFQDAAGDDIFRVADCTITEIGTLADLRASRFDESTGKLYDASSNAFVGTNNGSTLVGNAVPVYETGTWTGSIEFGGASAGQTYSTNNCNYTRTGNVVHVQGILSLTAKGSSTGTARIAGLPFTSSSDSSQAGLSVNYGTGFASLTSLPSALISGSSTTALLSNWGASGITTLTNANFTDATSIRFSGSYKIS
jgi:hypothetical protein